MSLLPDRITTGIENEVGVLIDGEVIAGSGPEETLASRVDASVIGVLRTAGPSDVRAAYTAAALAAPRWAAVGPAARAEVLHRAAELFRERADELAPVISADMGKPDSEAQVEVAKGAAVLDYYAELGYRQVGATFRTDFDEDIFTIIEPLGVVALITPWNFPFTIPIRKLSAALAAGNAVVFKPSPNASISGMLIATTLIDAGLDPGLLHVILGSGSPIEEELLGAPELDGVSLTGSYQTAAAIHARLPVHVPFQAELGGKNTLVVWEDADLGKAIEIIQASSFRNNGQICTSAGRILVHEHIYDQLLGRLSDVVTSMTDSTGVDEFGILVSEREARRIEGFVSVAESEAERIVRPASWSDGRVAPTVLVEPTTGTLTAEEIFGPVVTFERVSGIDDAIAKANATAYGLTSGIVTADLSVARQFWQGSHTGTVKVNSPLTGVPFHVPFEGYGRSGAGWAEGGESSLDFFTRTKTVFLRS